MNKTLRALYNGEIFPAKQYLPKDDEYADLRENYNQRYEELVKKLGSPLDKEFEQIMDTQLEILYHEFYEMFIEGFCLGAKIVIKVYESENKNANS